MTAPENRMLLFREFLDINYRLRPAPEIEAASLGWRKSMLTKKGKYGLKALSALAELPPGQLAFVNDIATRNNIPKKFLDAILAELRNAGFVHSRKGKLGGYCLAKPAEDIQIGHVVRVLDGPLAPIPCASKTRYQPCPDCDEAICQVRHLMLDVRNAIAQVLDNTSLSQMRSMGGAEALETGLSTS